MTRALPDTHGWSSRDLHDLATEYGIRSPGMQPAAQSQQWIDRVLNVHLVAHQDEPREDLRVLVEDACRHA